LLSVALVARGKLLRADVKQRSRKASQASRIVGCQNVPMATATHNTLTDSPLYRMDAAIYARLVEAGALAGVDVDLVDGLLVDKLHQGPDQIHRLDTDTYNRMVATGALEDEPVELLEGLLVEMSPQGSNHAATIVRLTRHLASAHAWLAVQLPLEVKPRSEPEPDLVLTEAEPSFEHHFRTAVLVVEVAVTSHKKDRQTKALVYARAHVPTYWLVDVPAKTIEVRTGPGPDGYGRCEIYGAGSKVPSPAEGVADLDVTELFASADSDTSDRLRRP
jgi:Uma2 family endonuclease